jgi:hypothetical protein
MPEAKGFWKKQRKQKRSQKPSSGEVKGVEGGSTTPES